MKKIIIFLTMIVLLPFGMVAQQNRAMAWASPQTDINGFEGANGASIAVDIDNNNNTVNRIAIMGIVGFPTSTTLFEEFLNDGNANFTSGDLPALAMGGGDNIYADFDNDGDKDYLSFATLNGQNSSVGVFCAEKTNAGWQVQTNHGLPALNTVVLIIYDFDNDGLLDVFVSGYTGVIGVGYAGWFHNNGNFTFSEVQTFPGLWQASGDIGDVDWDGDPDIIYTGYNGGVNKMYLLRNNAGTFSVEDISTGQGFIPVADGDIAFGDKNNDGNIDYFASAGFGPGDYIAQFRKADGSGLFDQALTAPFAPMLNPTIEFTDTNNDGKIEIFAAGIEAVGSGIPVANLYENSSGDIFSLESSFDGFGSGDVVIEDFNGDGYKDIM